MAEKKLTNAELDKAGLACIELGWDNEQKLTALFHHYAEQKESLPASGVNDQGDAVPNLSYLARLGKIIQGKQVFKRVYAGELLDAAIKKCGIVDLSKPDVEDETQIVREHLQSNIDSARRDASDTDKKLKSALVKVDALTEVNRQMKADIADLKSKLALSKSRTVAAEQRVIKGMNQELQSLKRVFD